MDTTFNVILLVVAFLMYLFYKEIVTYLIFNFGTMSANVYWRKKLHKSKEGEESETNYKRARRHLMEAIKERIQVDPHLNRFWLKVGELNERHNNLLIQEISSAGYEVSKDGKNWLLEKKVKNDH